MTRFDPKLTSSPSLGTLAAMTIDIFESAVRPQGRLGAVFERDDETAHFYLLDLCRPDGHQIIGAFLLAAVVTMPPEACVRVTWTPEGDMAGLFLEGRLFAVFDLPSADADVCEGREAKPGEQERFLHG
jgi:hypothetical protein